MLRLRLAHFDAVLAQPIDRAANLAPQCTRRVRLHRDQQIAGAGIFYFAKRLRNREVTRVGFSAQLAQLCDLFSNRRRGIESQFMQPRRASIEIFLWIRHVCVSRMKSLRIDRSIGSYSAA